LQTLKGRDHLRDLAVDGRMTFLWILKKYDIKMWAGFVWHGIGVTEGLL
jgi:hypothetical protein